ncbi:LRR receptor-like serine/threonine-protein kinase HSL2 [Elaeis guineensis]|uniref:LRR receptor-like serine/threonine-protein kinase HSL2 n=1 Tax=Elaeis guineensis var. tenera TaxID=51953 RepID=UPI003C6D3C0A
MPYNWTGVTCEPCFGTVSSNDLSNFNVAGGFPSGFYRIPTLRHLSLTWNDLSGGLPATNIALCSPVPSAQVLSLYSNLIFGWIPSFLANLTELTQFDLGFNPFCCGVRPSEIGNLTKVEVLGLPFANLTGDIPDSIGNLSSNGLTG